jgi:hypothetical protein
MHGHALRYHVSLQCRYISLGFCQFTNYKCTYIDGQDECLRQYLQKSSNPMKRNVSTWVERYLTSRESKKRYLQIHQVHDFFIVQCENSFENDDVRSIDCFGSFFSGMGVEIIYRDLH